MNRLNNLSVKSSEHSSLASQYEDISGHCSPLSAVADRRRPPRRIESPFSYFMPMHYESGYAYPLLIWLHDDGGNERQLNQVMRLISVRNYVAASIRGPIQASHNGKHFGWDNGRHGSVEAASLVDECVAEAGQRFNVHPRRVFVAGHGAGGTMAVRLAWQSPESFAGAISLDGALPRSGGAFRHVNRARKLPLMLVCCGQSPRFGEPQLSEDLRLLHSAGCSAAIRFYPHEDDLTSVMFSDVNDWAMARVCASSSALAAT